MVKMSLHCVFLLLALGASALVACAHAQQMQITYADEELPPFAMGNGRAQPDPPGIYVDLITRVARDLGITVKFQRQPTKRGQIMLKNGDVDALFSLSYNQERLELGQYPMKNGKPDGSRRIGAVTYYLYKLDTSPVEYDGKTIKNATAVIGANLGYSIADDIRKMGLAVDEVKSTDSNLKKLQLARIAAFAGQDIDTDALIETNAYTKIVKLPIPMASKDYFLVFSHQFMARHADMAEKFWTRLGEVRDDMTKTLAVKYR